MTRTFPQPATRLLWGAASGAVGATVLNIVTYGDMLMRGRPASGVPASVAGIMANRLGVAPLRTDNDAPQAPNRREAAGALLGYVTGVGLGAAYAVGRGNASDDNPLPSGLLLGLTAMLASNLPIVGLGVSDPRTWSRADWLADIIPHLAYGVTTAATYSMRRS